MTEMFKQIIAFMMANGKYLDLNKGVNGQYYLILFDGTTIIWEIDDRPDKDDVYFYDAWNNKFSFDNVEQYYAQALYVEELYENPLTD